MGQVKSCEYFTDAVCRYRYDDVSMLLSNEMLIDGLQFVYSAKQTPSPGEGRGRGLRPGGKGPPPPEEPFAGFKLKAVPLKFIKKLQNIVLQEAESIGSSAVFECEVSPSTAVTSWMKDDSNLRESPKHKFTSDGKDRKLNIIDVQLSDTGEYTCVAKNAGKEISCTAKLIVEGIIMFWQS